jgi:hypothetical protein
MTKLSDTQSIILNAAAQRDDRNAMPLPSSLRGGAATKVVYAMIAKGLLEEVDADLRKSEPVWRATGDGHGTTLVATDAGLAAIGIADTPATPAQQSAPKTRDGTKQQVLIDLLKGPDGATIDEIVAATGWQKHTARGAMSGALKKRLGLTITSEKEERGRVYRIT